jgi:hypothetical protein
LTKDKKAWGVARLQGGIFRVIEVLAEPTFDENLKVIRHAIEFLALMSKRSIANCAVIAKMCGVPLIMAAATRHKDKAKMFGPISELIENLCLHAQVMRALLDNDVVAWIIESMRLYQATATTFTALLKMLRMIVRHPVGAARFNDVGGLDVVLPFVKQHLTKLPVTKAASFLLWTMQLHDLPDVSRLESIYGFRTNFVPLAFNVDKLSPEQALGGRVNEEIDDEKVSIDDKTALMPVINSERNEDESRPQESVESIIFHSKWDANQYIPEFFDPTSPDVQAFLTLYIIDICL